MLSSSKELTQRNSSVLLKKHIVLEKIINMTINRIEMGLTDFT